MTNDEEEAFKLAEVRIKNFMLKREAEDKDRRRQIKQMLKDIEPVRMESRLIDRMADLSWGRGSFIRAEKVKPKRIGWVDFVWDMRYFRDREESNNAYFYERANELIAEIEAVERGS
ncbi:hypothetical protein [Gordonia sp. SMJS1]|uniref:hypothetical protein n=1 Tax=Gordonia sp. SMJS1 TaxID=3039400 RepID=UPI002457D29B|nr:hypothetical protein [Gordonia sp. SMJS1]WGJ86994.1 hypothetical protein QAD21_07720 [Gordonia sp. SMJS1]